MTAVRERVLGRLDYTPDRFQFDAFDVVDAGASVLVAAPTSAGKTLVAEYAIEAALADGRRAFYTAPIKALSNQKLKDLGEIFGTDSVGLLTGDNVVRPDAPVVVMTTEVLRNMIYAESDALDGLGVVILDEIHYLMDRYRGPVWEEVIVQLDASVQLVCLSATVSNAGEVVDWLRSVRGPTESVIELTRPVRLHNAFLLGDKATGQARLFSTLDDSGKPNPKVIRLTSRDDQGPEGRRGDRGRGGRPRGARRFFAPRRPEVVLELAAEGLLPAIYFVFSRAGCEAAARACAEAGIRLLDSAEDAARLDEIITRHLGRVDEATARALRADAWHQLLRRGIAAHHAGMVPLMKEAVEEAFAEGLLQVVFATETLAMGVNLPARSVVIESLSKYRGDGHSLLTPGEYTQLTGRAGRRGIDERGDAVVLWSPFVPFEQVAMLATSNDFQLTSAFRPTWNMAANLVATSTQEGAHTMLGSSLAQFQADRLVVSLRRRLEKVTVEQARLQTELEEELGDRLVELRALGAGAAVPTTETGADPTLFDGIRPGAVIVAPDGEPVAVLSTAQRGDDVRVRVVSGRGQSRVLTGAQMSGPPEVLGRIDLPQPYQPTRRVFQAAVARTLRSFGPAKRRRPGRSRGEDQLARPVQRSLKRLARLDDDRRRLEYQIGRSESDLVATFDTLISELAERGYVHDWSLTAKGRALTSIYHESDLVVAECLTGGLFDGLDAPELAALVSCLVYEYRSPDPPPTPWFPSGEIRRRFNTMVLISEEVTAVERRCRITESRPPDAGFVALAHGWALEVGVDDLLDDDRVSGGDFVRTMRQLIDLLRQLAHVTQPDVASAARTAAGRLDRGLVAAASLDGAETAGSADETAAAEPPAIDGTDADPSG